MKIIERKSTKVPCETSLYVSFDYNAKIVNTIKQDCCYWNAKSQEWEVPITSLANIVNASAPLFDIEIELLPEEKKKEEKQIRLNTSKYNTTPFKHQIDAIKYGLQNEQWLLLDGMGLGKSASSIYLAQELKSRENIKHCLVVCCVNSLKYNWVKEIKLHTNLSCTILGQKLNKKGEVVIGSVQDRVNHLNSKIDEFFVITNIETLRDENIQKALLKGPNKFDMCICDEIHNCKNPQSQQCKGLLKINSKYKVGLTGTILLNTPMDVFVPLKWINKQHGGMSNFKSYYCQYGGWNNSEIVGYKNLDVLKSQLDSFSLRRTKDLLELPPKTIIDEYVEMDNSQRTFYDNIVNGVVSQADKVNLDTTNLLSMISRLREATACPSMLSSEDISSAKIDRAVQLVEESISNNEKIVIFSTFKETATILGNRLSKYSPLVCTGDSKDSYINDAIEKFQKNDKYKVFIATWQKCGTGITLTAARNMIFIDTPWTKAIFEQACDRIYRIGTSKSVFIYNLITKDTVDERVKEILDLKGAMSDFLVDGKIDKKLEGMLKKIITDLSDSEKIF